MTKQEQGEQMNKFFLEYKSVPTPNKLQMLSAVRGHDYRYRARRFPAWLPALVIALVIGSLWGLFLLFESMIYGR